MKNQVYEINSDGFLTGISVVDFREEGIPAEELGNNFVIIRPPDGLYRAKWTGSEWVEDMTQEEMDALNNEPQPLSEIEQLRLENAKANAELFEMMLMLNGGGM